MKATGRQCSPTRADASTLPLRSRVAAATSASASASASTTTMDAGTWPSCNTRNYLPAGTIVDAGASPDGSTVYHNGAIVARDAVTVTVTSSADRYVPHSLRPSDDSVNYRLRAAGTDHNQNQQNGTHSTVDDCDADDISVAIGVLPPPPSAFLDDKRSVIYCNGSQLSSNFELSAVPQSPDYALWQPRFAFSAEPQADQLRCTCGLDKLIDRDAHATYQPESTTIEARAAQPASSLASKPPKTDCLCSVRKNREAIERSGQGSSPGPGSGPHPNHISDSSPVSNPISVGVSAVSDLDNNFPSPPSPPPPPPPPRHLGVGTGVTKKEVPEKVTQAKEKEDAVQRDREAEKEKEKETAQETEILQSVGASHAKRLSIASIVQRTPKLSTIFMKSNSNNADDESRAPHTADGVTLPVRQGSTHARSVSTPAQATHSLLAINEEILECRRLLIEQGVLRIWNRTPILAHTDSQSHQLQHQHHSHQHPHQHLTSPQDEESGMGTSNTGAVPLATSTLGPSSVTSSSGSNSDPQVISGSSTISNINQQPVCLRTPFKLLGRVKAETALVLEGDAITMSVLRSPYWSFSRTQLKRSITPKTNLKREADALQMFDGILSFSGIRTKMSRQVNMVDRYEVVQLLIKKCLEADDFSDEFYLQLIKQTSDNPEPGGPVSLANWHLLTIACGIVPPANQLIGRYLTAHLRKMSVVKQNIDESRLAQRCSRLLTSMSDKPRRKCPPSCKEIMSVTNKKPVHEKVFILDGRIVLIEIHPHVTAHQVCTQAKSSINMRQSARHFALYEVHHTYERAMQADTYLCDSLFVWEQYAKKHRAVREVRYMMKKKLFIEPFMSVNDHVEVELIYSQLINEVFEGRIPVSMDSVVALCALIAQAEVGDYSPDHANVNADKPNDVNADFGKNVFDYRTTTRILPRDMRERVALTDIYEKHQKYVGFSLIDTRLESIALIKSWNLCGAGLFRVTQENSILTRSFVLAVNATGVHFLSGSVSQSNLGQSAPFASYPFSHIVCLSPELESLTLTVRGQTRELEKNVFRTTQAYQIVDLITDYMMELRLSRVNHSEPTRRRKNRSKTLTVASCRRGPQTPDGAKAATQSDFELNGNGNGNGNGNARLCHKNRVQSGSTSTSSNSEVLSQTHSTPS